MDWLSHLFIEYPAMAVYLAMGIGYLIGKLKFHGVGLGVVTGSLLGGIFLGNFFCVPICDQAKSMLFLLFLFAIGYYLYVTVKRLAGRTLQDIADILDEAHSVLLRGILRGDQALPMATETLIERGDASLEVPLGAVIVHRSLWPHFSDDMGNHHRFLVEFAFGKDC
jgi:uncharacterized transporter YbjL